MLVSYFEKNNLSDNIATMDMLTNNIKIIFLPGNGGGDINAPDKWFPYLKRQFEDLGFKVVSQNFPDPIKARSEYWLSFIEKLGADENTILIGHSSGAVAAMRYAEGHKILGSVLVAGNHSDLGMGSEKASGYFDNPWNWEAIKNNQKWIVQFHSQDDPLVPVKEAREISRNLSTDYIEMEDQQHFGHPTPKLEFPEIVNIVKQKILTN